MQEEAAVTIKINPQSTPRNSSRGGQPIAGKVHKKQIYASVRYYEADGIDTTPELSKIKRYNDCKSRIRLLVTRYAKKDFHGHVSVTYATISRMMPPEFKEYIDSALGDLHADKVLRYNPDQPQPSRIYLQKR